VAEAEAESEKSEPSTNGTDPIASTESPAAAETGSTVAEPVEAATPEVAPPEADAPEAEAPQDEASDAVAAD
jgi:hypothetical protein